MSSPFLNDPPLVMVARVNRICENGENQESYSESDYSFVVRCVPNFSVSDQTATTYQSVDFYDWSTGAYSWLWDFGDGVTSSLQNPSHRYETGGIYDVSLTINGILTETKPAYIEVGDSIIQKGIDRLAEQYRHKPRLVAYLSILLAELQELEGVFNDIKLSRMIATATGYSLDIVGSIVDEPRGGKSDDDYRAAIQFKCFVNSSQCTPNYLLGVLRGSVGSEFVRVLEKYPCHVNMFVGDALVSESISTRMSGVVAAGVSISVDSVDADIPFGFYGDDDCDGFGADGLSGGGSFSGRW